MKYHIVQFVDGIMVVCDSWIDVNRQSCFIPSEKIGRKLKKEDPPDKKWKSYNFVSILLSHDDLDYANYRARQFEQKGSISATDEDKPRKRPQFDKESLRAKSKIYEMNIDTESVESSSDSNATPTSGAVESRLRLKRGYGFTGTFPEPPTTSILVQETRPVPTTSSPLPQERDASPLAILQESNISTRSSNDDRNNETTGCHCIHQEHSAKELLRVMLRIEQRVCNLPVQPNESLNNGPEEELFEYAATTSDEIEKLFNDFKDEEEKRNSFIEKGKREVSKNKKKSIERILLILAPPSAWKEFSKLGQRGKRSAMAIGLHTFLTSCLRKIHRINTSEDKRTVTHLMGEVLKRMEQISRRKSLQLENIFSGGTTRAHACSDRDSPQLG